MTEPAGIDPRVPRFAAAITSVLLLVATLLGLLGVEGTRTAGSYGWFAYQPSADATFVPGAQWSTLVAQRIAEPAFLLAAGVAALFLWGVLAPRTYPWAVLYRRLVAPRLPAPGELEDPRPPRFAQGVGLFVVGIGLALHLAGVPWALPAATAAAFIAAFLNAAFDLCLGCRIYLLLQRTGLLGRETGTA